MKTGILFDLDGTLLNTLEDLTDSTNYALAQFGCPPRTLEEIRHFVGNGALNQIRCSLPGKESDPPLEQVLAVYQAYYPEHSQIKTRPYDGIPEILEVLRKQYPVAIVSNKPDKAVKRLCSSIFPDVFALGEAPGCPRKPAPDMVYQGMKAIGAERCIYVGDSEVDVLTAHNAGVPCLSVLWGFRDQKTIEDAGGTHFCENPRDLPEALNKIMEQMKYGK